MRKTVAIVAAATFLTACAPAAVEIATEDSLQVVATTGILADLASNVAGEHAEVISLVPEGGDPHSYEPSLRDVRSIVYADVAFSNYLMLEEHNLIKTLDTNLRDGVPNIALAEEAVKYAAEIIPLVEDVALDTIWLGVRVSGTGEPLGATRTSEVVLSATGMEGPGVLAAYLTGSFGDIDMYFDSSDGFDAASGFAGDTVSLPPDAHTHLSWAFTEPGYYTLDLNARLLTNSDTPSQQIASGTATFAVGVDPYSTPGMEGAPVLESGHSDITVNLDDGSLEILLDHSHNHGDSPHREYFPLDDVVIEVPGAALHEVPPDPAYRFLGRSGDLIYQLPQAVLGKHVHGEIDPHLWQNVRNAMAYVQIMRDALIEVDPANALDYTRNAAAYLEELAELDEYVSETIATIPESRRVLITTHDAYGYLGAAYGVRIAGFVSPNPAVEPSMAERKRLTETIRNLDVPAVFLEPNLISRSSTLREIAGEQNVRVCEIYGDAFTREVNTYIEMMRFNAHSLVECLKES